MQRPGPHLIAWGDGDLVPAWLRRTEGESVHPIRLVLAVAIASQYALPARFALSPRYIAPSVEFAALVVFALVRPRGTFTRHNAVRQAVTQVFLGVVAAVNVTSLVFLVHAILNPGRLGPIPLLGGGVEIWVTNVLVFGMWYWLTDRQGPGARAEGLDKKPDFLFPQMTDSELAKDWEPRLLDYLYVSFTNSTAFSPTDTMPLSSWVKGLFTLQSVISLITVALVAARAINVLPS